MGLRRGGVPTGAALSRGSWPEGAGPEGRREIGLLSGEFREWCLCKIPGCRVCAGTRGLAVREAESTVFSVPGTLAQPLKVEYLLIRVSPVIAAATPVPSSTSSPPLWLQSTPYFLRPALHGPVDYKRAYSSSLSFLPTVIFQQVCPGGGLR